MLRREKARYGRGSRQASACPVKKPMERPSTLAEVLSGLAQLEEDFVDFDDPPTKPEHCL